MCHFKYDEFKCGCQRYHFSGLEPCDAYLKTGNSLDAPVTILIPRTDEHDDIDQWPNGVRYQTMPQDTNILFRWHFCKKQTYGPVTVKDPAKDPCPWHVLGMKKKYVKDQREESREKRQREKVGVRYERGESNEKGQGLEKEHGCVVQ